MPVYIEKSGDLVGCYQCATYWLTDWQQNIVLFSSYKVYILSWITQLCTWEYNFLLLVFAVIFVNNCNKCPHYILCLFVTMILMYTLIKITSTNNIALVTSQHIVRGDKISKSCGLWQILMFFMTINAGGNDDWSLTNLWWYPIWKRLHSFGEFNPIDALTRISMSWLQTDF